MSSRKGGVTWFERGESRTPVTKALLDGLSEDLYSISDPPQEPLPSRRQVQRKLIQVGEAIEARNWDVAPNLLREINRQVEPSLLSELRGEIWQAAGDDKTAKLFFNHAASLTPELAEKN